MYKPRTYKYAVAVKDYYSEIYMEMVEFDEPKDWKEVYLAVVDDDYFGDDPQHKEWVMSMSEHFEDAKAQLREGSIDVEILVLGYSS